MKLHEYLEEYGISKTQCAEETGISRSQISDICNDGFTNSNRRIVPCPATIKIVRDWSGQEVDYADWYTP
jgi:transcriptional regulator with XRE-family HTH domain